MRALRDKWITFTPAKSPQRQAKKQLHFWFNEGVEVYFESSLVDTLLFWKCKILLSYWDHMRSFARPLWQTLVFQFQSAERRISRLVSQVKISLEKVRLISRKELRVKWTARSAACSEICSEALLNAYSRSTVGRLVGNSRPPTIDGKSFKYCCSTDQWQSVEPVSQRLWIPPAWDPPVYSR